MYFVEQCDWTDASLFYSVLGQESKLNNYFSAVQKNRKSFTFLQNLNSARKSFDTDMFYNVSNSIKICQRICSDNNIDFNSFITAMIGVLQQSMNRLVFLGCAQNTKEIICQLLRDSCLGNYSNDPLSQESVLSLHYDDIPNFVIQPAVSFLTNSYSGANMYPTFAVNTEISNGVLLRKRLNPLLFELYLQECEAGWFV